MPGYPIIKNSARKKPLTITALKKKRGGGGPRKKEQKKKKKGVFFLPPPKKNGGGGGGCGLRLKITKKLNLKKWFPNLNRYDFGIGLPKKSCFGHFFTKRSSE